MDKIIRAIQRGNEGRVKRLLDADPELLESGDYVGDRPLIVATRLGHLEMVRVLVDRGANSNATGFGAKTALHWAADLGHDEIVELLVNKGADANARDSKGNTPFIWASKNGHMGVVRTLLAHMGVEGLQEREAGGDAALHCAAHWGHEEVVRLLLTTGAQADERGAHGRTALMCASKKGQLGVVKILYQHVGTQGLEEKDEDGQSALHYAAVGGSEEVVSYLLSQGAQASSRDKAGRTVLMMACGRGHVGVVKILHQHMGPQGLLDVTVYGWTALHCAAKDRHEDVMKFLLVNGADPTISDQYSRTPRAIARGGGEMLWSDDESEDHDEDTLAERKRGVAVFEWWRREPERRALLHRATCLHKAYTTQRDQPTSQVPTYLEARVAAGHAVPVVEVVSRSSSGGSTKKEQHAGALGKRKAAGRKKAGGKRGQAQGAEAQRHAVLEYVVKALNEQLLIELLEGLRFA